jgi:hypothetical protein
MPKKQKGGCNGDKTCKPCNAKQKGGATAHDFKPRKKKTGLSKEELTERKSKSDKSSEIIKLLSEGFSRKEIEKKLNIKPVLGRGQKGNGAKIDAIMKVAKTLANGVIKVGGVLWKNKDAILAAIELGATVASIIDPKNEAAQRTAEVAGILAELGGKKQKGGAFHRSSNIFVPNTGEMIAPTSVYDYNSLSAAPYTGRLIFE